MADLSRGEVGQLIVRTIQSTFFFSGIGLILSLLQGQSPSPIIPTVFINFLLAAFIFGLLATCTHISILLGFPHELGPHKPRWLFISEVLPWFLWFGVSIALSVQVEEHKCMSAYTGMCVLALPVEIFAFLEL
ncbi:hypothetical protein EG329_000946 [Mollisiaceae sp. DMI_Dod_QoI]|nr:hypothetical protein EG329_000946 [Helotiales sp. DMI_Dod_QoI]